MTRPSGRRPRRGQTSRTERRVIRVLTEGKITEPSYLTAWARRYRHSVRLSLPESGMAPETLVDHATQHMRRRRRSRRGDQDFDEIWCVFDIDQHPERADFPTQRTAKWHRGCGLQSLHGALARVARRRSDRAYQSTQRPTASQRTPTYIRKGDSRQRVEYAVR